MLEARLEPQAAGKRCGEEGAMRCGDLGIYLEAYLEGRLGRSRALALKRHLAHCRRCAECVQRLRAFERQITARLPALRGAVPSWAGLEAEPVGSDVRPVVRSMLPPPSHLLRLPAPAPQRRTAAPPRAVVRRPGRARLWRQLASRFLGLMVLAAAAAAALHYTVGWLALGLEGRGGETAPGAESGFGAPSLVPDGVELAAPDLQAAPQELPLPQP